MVDLALFRRHVKDKSPAFVPLFQNQSRYQVAWGGAGCVHPETRIHTEHGLIRICDIDRPMRVLSWNAKTNQFQLSLSGGAFPKGKANLYRVVTQQGEFVASGHHRTLCADGRYLDVRQLQCGDELMTAAPFLDQTNSELGLKSLPLGDQHCSQILEDWMGNYADEARRYGLRLLSQEGFDQGEFPSLTCAPLFDLPCGLNGHRESEQSRIRHCQYSYLQPKTCSGGEEPRMACGEACRNAEASFERTSHSPRGYLLSPMSCEPHQPALEPSPFSLLPQRERSSCSNTCNASSTAGSTTVLRIERTEASEYWDMQVLDTNNYVTEDGCVHHNSGKSHIVARKILYRLLKESHVKHNFLIIRKVDRTIKRSVFTLMRNLISRWKLTSEFDVNLTDKTIIYRPTGSQIMFSGLDDVEKLKSIEGVTSIWCEEATELTQEDFEQLDLRLRGDHGCLKQIILTLNPISEQHWIKKIFFDSPMQGVFTLHTTYLDNAFIDDEYKMVMENKKVTNPRYYNIYALGNWGTAEGLVFTRVEQRLIRPDEIVGLDCVQGLDFGYTNDPTAFCQAYVDMTAKRIYVFDGFYDKGMSNAEIADEIKKLGAHRHKTTADSSEPKSIDYIKGKGVNVIGALKGKDSISAGIDFLSEFQIIVNSHLVEFMSEFNNYSWALDKSTGKPTNKPVDDFNHFIDSLRYAMESLSVRKRGFFG